MSDVPSGTYGRPDGNGRNDHMVHVDYVGMVGDVVGSMAYVDNCDLGNMVFRHVGLLDCPIACYRRARGNCLH